MIPARALVLSLSLFAIAYVAAPRRSHADDKLCSAEVAAVNKMSKRDLSLAYPKNAVALQHMEAAKRAFGVQQYDKAIGEYTSAGLADEAPLILYNLGQTYRAAKNYEKAIRQYELFLERGKPGPEVHALIACHITSMKAELEHAASTAPPIGPAADHVETPTTRRNGSPTTSDDAYTHPGVTSPVAVSTASTTTPRGSRSWDRIGWGLVAVGVAGASVATWLAISSAGLDNDATNDESAPASTRLSLQHRADSRRRAAFIAGIGSGAVLTLGIVKLAILSGEAPRPAGTAWNIGITGNGVAVFGRF